MESTDICVVGAGPGGIAAALKLNLLGLPCTLLEKSTFPRDKICGDAISGKATTLLNRLDPEIAKRFNAIHKTYTPVWGIRFVAPNYKTLDIPFYLEYNPEEDIPPGYVCRRTDFDNFLAEEARNAAHVNFVEGFDAGEISKIESGGYIVHNKLGEACYQTKILIVANGAQSQFSRKMAGIPKEHKHFAGAIRAYYKNIGGMHENNFLELHYLKEINPGYLWIFPLPDGHANIGLGMRSDHIKRKRVNLTKVLESVVVEHPTLKHRFANAERIGPIRGFGLPLGSKLYSISGPHYMLVGDAAHLIDPMTGEGIGNAIYSGMIAAEQAQACLEQNDFSADFLQAYDKRVKRVMGPELKISFQIQKFLSKTFITNLLARIIIGNPGLIKMLSRMYTDMELRKRVAYPGFWLKVLLRRKV